MATDYKFMDAGKKIEAYPEPAKTEKIYPKFCVDLDEFPGLEAEMDESVELHLRGRVCSLTHNEWSHTMEIEVQHIAIPTHTHDTVGPRNEADQALGKLRSGKGMGRY